MLFIIVNFPESNLEVKWLFQKFLFVLNKFLLICFWQPCVVLAFLRLSVVTVSWGYSSLQYMGFWLQWLLLWSTGSSVLGSVVAAHGLSCSVACGIFLDQGLNSCPLHWQVDSYPLYHQGIPDQVTITIKARYVSLSLLCHVPTVNAGAPWKPKRRPVSLPGKASSIYSNIISPNVSFGAWEDLDCMFSWC